MIIRRVGLYTLISFLVFLVMVPLLWMVSISLRSNVEVFSIPLNLLPVSPNLDAYKQIFGKPDMIRLF
jgi:ABC-type glycerol-3-phosphate transport system permease component